MYVVEHFSQMTSGIATHFLPLLLILASASFFFLLLLLLILSLTQGRPSD
jgi:hypothetical protein